MLPPEISTLIFQHLIPERIVYDEGKSKESKSKDPVAETQERPHEHADHPHEHHWVIDGHEITDDGDIHGDDEDAQGEHFHYFDDEGVLIDGNAEVRRMIRQVESELAAAVKRRESQESDEAIAKRMVSGARDIIHASKVCRGWREWTEDNFLWARLCAAHWKDKQGLHEYVEEAEAGPAKARLTKAFWAYPNGWKRAFRVIEAERKRTHATKPDLMHTTWTFQYNGTLSDEMQMYITFEEDRVHYHDAFEHHDLSMPWRITSKGRVAVAQYNHLHIRRAEHNWGWHLHNRYVYLLSVSTYTFRHALEGLAKDLEGRIVPDDPKTARRRSTRRRPQTEQPNAKEISEKRREIDAYLHAEAARDSSWKRVRADVITDHWSRRPRDLESLQLGLIDVEMMEDDESDDETFVDGGEEIDDWYDSIDEEDEWEVPHLADPDQE